MDGWKRNEAVVRERVVQASRWSSLKTIFISVRSVQATCNRIKKKACH